MEYYKDGIFSHIIPKDGKQPDPTKRKILIYLRRNNVVSEEQIAKDLCLDISNVEQLLSEMERTGEVEKIGGNS